MKAALVILCLAGNAAVAAAEPDEAKRIREVRFTGTSAVDEMCACLLDARQAAELQGRIDLNVEVAFAGDADISARIWMGPAHAVGRIHFTGHYRINDSTLRRALTLYERDLLDVTRLRRSLTRINRLGLFEPVTLSDIQVARRDDGVTVDLTIPLLERKRRWWTLSGPLIPGFGTFHASISSRLPPWGRGLFEASTYYVTFNAIGLVPGIATVWPLGAKAGPAAVVLARPVIPGQELLSGFAISPRSSPHTLLTQYGTTHLARGVSALLDEDTLEPLVVPVTAGAQSGREVLVCRPPKPRLWWLRRSLGMLVQAALM